MVSFDAVGEGMVQDVTGDVLYPVRYTAIVFMPYKDEVLDVVVTEVT